MSATDACHQATITNGQPARRLADFQQFMITQDSTAVHRVHFLGPCPSQDATGEEIPVWFVFVGDIDGDPVDVVSPFFNFKTAQCYARELAKTKRLSLITDAMLC